MAHALPGVGIKSRFYFYRSRTFTRRHGGVAVPVKNTATRKTCSRDHGLLSLSVTRVKYSKFSRARRNGCFVARFISTVNNRLFSECWNKWWFGNFLDSPSFTMKWFYLRPSGNRQLSGCFLSPGFSQVSDESWQRTRGDCEFVCTQVDSGPQVIRRLHSFRFKPGCARFRPLVAELG